jgi:hypothetical protein
MLEHKGEFRLTNSRCISWQTLSSYLYSVFFELLIGQPAAAFHHKNVIPTKNLWVRCRELFWPLARLVRRGGGGDWGALATKKINAAGDFVLIDLLWRGGGGQNSIEAPERQGSGGTDENGGDRGRGRIGRMQERTLQAESILRERKRRQPGPIDGSHTMTKRAERSEGSSSCYRS